ncbi:MAG: Ldh family oxidoreductase [Chloroflexi bacterium]|nr:Ldh family oxidoreductase [Chloroflexota bacterium]
MPIISSQDLLSLGERIFIAAGAPPAYARLVSSALVESNLEGHDSHGVIRISHYIGYIKEGRLQPAASPKIIRQNASTALVDGQVGFGQVGGQFAVDLALQRLQVGQSIVAIGLENTFHVGRAGDYPRRLCDAGYVGIAWVNGTFTSAAVTPYGATQRLLGTNPFTIALPTQGSFPWVLDYATSVSAEGKLRVARDKKVPVPPGVIVTKEGQPTTDPEDYYAGGMLLTMAGYKGHCLSLMVEALAGILTGNGCGALPHTQKPGNGMLLIGLDIEAFRPLAEFTGELGELTDALHQAATAPGQTGALAPGEVEYRARQQRSVAGISLPDQTWRDLSNTAIELGVAVPAIDGH